MQPAAFYPPTRGGEKGVVLGVCVFRLARFPAVVATRSWRIFAGITTILGVVGIVSKSFLRQLLGPPIWSFILLGCVVLVYTVFTTAYEEWKDRAESEAQETDKEAVKAIAEAALVRNQATSCGMARCSS